jgi:5'-deoxynucleotidase YfbR-like HD superfamily hydrolase
MPTVNREGHWYNTNGGRKFYVLDPRVEDVDISDIAHALSWKYRFGGHLDRPFSVAQHSLAVARIVKPEYAFEALLHDASEAYLPDVLSPIKKAILNFKEIEDRVESSIHQRFRLPFPLTDEAKFCIKKVDWVSVLIEHELFFDNQQNKWEQVPFEKYQINMDDYDRTLWLTIQTMQPWMVKNAFLRTFKDLAKQRYGEECIWDFFPKLLRKEA